MNRVRVLAHAKVNLHLRVLGRRADGYHDLETIFQAIDLHDVLEIEEGGAGVALSVTGEDEGPVEDNLVARAARAFLARAGRGLEGVRVRLEKRIPTGAGLGGGSSDAAATLRALDALFPRAVPPEEIRAIAEGLGSDVPFFLGPTPLALGRGRGEVIEPITPLPSLPGVVVLPEGRVATASAYRELDLQREGKPAAASQPLGPPSDWNAAAASARNDFEPVVGVTRPDVGRTLAALRETKPRLSLLSGSGSASFALYDSEEGAEAAAARLGGVPDLRVIPVSTLDGWPDRP